MIIELFENKTFTKYLELPLPERLETIYTELQQQKKLKMHEITLIYNGSILPIKGNCSEYQLTETSKIRFIPPIPITLKSITPNEGTMYGGTTVYIDGRFPYSNRRYKVLFGTTEVIVNFYTFDKLKVITPFHQPGVVNVTVCYEGGNISNSVLFTFYSINGFGRIKGRCSNTPSVDISDFINNPVL